MIVPPKRWAMASARADLPLAVGPATMRAAFGLPPASVAVRFPPAMSYVTTIVARRDAISLSPAILNHIRNAIRGGAPIILSPGEAADIPVSTPPDHATLRDAIEGKPIDAITVKTRGRRKALLIADMDSTMIEGETLDELAAFAGIGEQIAAITRRAMNGELDFKAALRERVAMLKGLSLDALDKTWARIRLTPGARELVLTMRARGATTALVSGGFHVLHGAGGGASLALRCTGRTSCWMMGRR